MLSKVPPAVVALALVLGAAPAFAQPVPAPAGAAPEGSTAARTLEQNRRVGFWQPAPSETLRGTAAGSAAPTAPAARVNEARAAPPAGRAGFAAGGKPGARGRG
jgi:hypothetical protein